MFHCGCASLVLFLCSAMVVYSFDIHKLTGTVTGKKGQLKKKKKKKTESVQRNDATNFGYGLHILHINIYILLNLSTDLLVKLSYVLGYYHT